MFDTVHYTCPNCGEEASTQTKWGPCSLNDYTIDNAPLSILASFEEYGVPYPCKACGETPMFKLVPVRGIMYSEVKNHYYD